MVRDPAVFLFDEPLSNLDAKMRVQMRTEISRLHHHLGATMIYVTHDQVEAMTMGQRIVVMEGGEVQQVDTPLNLYSKPVNRFVAGFIGSPAMNFLEGEFVRDGGLGFRCGDAVVPLPEGWSPPAVEGRTVLGFRPEHVDLVDAGGVEAPIQVLEPLGNETLLYTEIGGAAVTLRAPGTVDGAVDDVVRLALRAGHVHVFDAATGAAMT